jgi:regulator of sirC expression with transglutaminase-like and TPR domain
MPSEVRPKVFLALARAYSALHHTESALRAYDAVVALEPENIEALAAGCWIRGLLDIEHDRALNQCQQALALDPGDAQIVEDRCLVYFRMGNYAKAEADCSGAATFPPTAPRALYLRGLVRLKRGDGVGGSADIGAAKLKKADIANDFAANGLVP